MSGVILFRLGEPVQYQSELLGQLRASRCRGDRRVHGAGPYVRIEVDGLRAGHRTANHVAVHVYVGI